MWAARAVFTSDIIIRNGSIMSTIMSELYSYETVYLELSPSGKQAKEVCLLKVGSNKKISFKRA